MAHSVKLPIDSGGAKSSDIYKDVHMEMITSSNSERNIVDMSGALNASAALSASTALKINENSAKNGSEQTFEKQGSAAASSGIERSVQKESLHPKKAKAISTLHSQAEESTSSSLNYSGIKSENSIQSSTEVDTNIETITPLKPEAFIDGIEKFVNFVSKERLTKRKTETPVSKETVSGGKKPDAIVPPEESISKIPDPKLNDKEMASKVHKKTTELATDTKKVSSGSAEDDVDADLKSYALAVNDMLESEVEVATDGNELDAEIKTIVVSNDDAGEIKMTFTDSAVGRFETIGKSEDAGSTLEGLSPLRKSSRQKKKKVYTDFDEAEDIPFNDELESVVEEVSKAIEDDHELKTKPEPTKSKSKRKNPSPKKAKLTVEEVYESDSNEESDGDISKDILKVRMAKCDVCEKHFLDRKKLMEHKKRHKKKSSQSDYPCLVCGKVFLKREHWRRHVKIHDDIRPFACPVCKKGFRRKEHVKRHMLIHTGEKPFECMFCSQRYQRADHLKKHLQQHTKDGSYKVKKRKGDSRPKANPKRRKPTSKAMVVQRSIKKEVVEEEEEHYSDGLSDDGSMAVNDELE